MKWIQRHPSRIDPEVLGAKAAQSLADTAAKQPHVNALTSWLDNRKNQNGFGEDFEFTLVPRGAK